MRLVAIGVLLLALAGCGSSPKTQFYTLLPVASAHEASSRGISGPPLQVGHVQLPATLDRDALVIQGAGAQVIVSDTDRWAAPLDELVQRALSADLRARLGTAAVLAPGDPTPAGGARELSVVVQRFDADSAGRVVLEADWMLGAGNPAKPGAIRHESIQEDAGSNNGGAIAAAMSGAVGKLADGIAGAVRP
jgi:hypothetical protein